MGCIYLITNIINKKRYVGQTKKAAEDRFSCLMNIEHGNNNPRLCKDITEYGTSVFDLDILEFCNQNQLDEREKYWIDKLNTRDENVGYNIQRGGGKNINDNEIVELYKKHKSVNKVKNITHHAHTYIENVLAKNNIKVLSIHEINHLRHDIDSNYIVDLYNKTKSIADVIKEVGGAYQTIYRILDERGIDYTVKKYEGIPIYRVSKDGAETTLFDDVYLAAKTVIEEKNLKPKFLSDIVANLVKCINGKRKTSYGYKWYKK